MKTKILYAVLFLCLPVGLLISVVVRREATYQGKSAIVWFEEIRQLGETNREAQSAPALNAMQHMGATAVPMLQSTLKSPERYRRAKAAWVLGQMGPTASNAVPDLIQAVGDADNSVQYHAIKALSAIGTTSEAVVPKLIAKLNSAKPGTDYFAAELLDKIERERKAQNMPPLAGDQYERAMAFVRSSLPSIRVKGAYRLANLPPGDERVTLALQSLLNDTNVWVRQQTAVFMKYPNTIKPELMNTAQSP